MDTATEMQRVPAAAAIVDVYARMLCFETERAVAMVDVLVCRNFPTEWST
jgi:hypothetical protein